jgi:hypothetical protein
MSREVDYNHINIEILMDDEELIDGTEKFKPIKHGNKKFDDGTASTKNIKKFVKKRVPNKRKEIE